MALKQLNLEDIKPEPDFDGATYVHKHDYHRLKGQLARIFDLMKDGRWRILREIADATGDPESSISAQLRNLRKERFGQHQILKQTRGDRSAGLYEYRLIPNEETVNEQAENQTQQTGKTAG